MMTTCYSHRDTPTPADRRPDCGTCRRIRLENELMVKGLLDAALALGYVLNVDNGGEAMELDAFTADRATILDAMQQADDDRLYLTRTERTPTGNRGGWVWFVYGNSGWDVISDYTTNLEPLLAPINAYVDNLLDAGGLDDAELNG